MSEGFIGEIRMFAGNFPPAGWMFCDGALIPIAENDALFTLLGTTYGGDGQSTFALPDLRGRVPLHVGTGGGQSYVLGEPSGVESVTLVAATMPTHTHAMTATSTAQTLTPTGAKFAVATSTQAGANAYLPGNANVALKPNITPAGGSQPHNNIQPSLAINFIISLFGLFPHT